MTVDTPVRSLRSPQARQTLQRAALYAVAGLVLISVVEWVTGIGDLTSSGTIGATLRLGMPILMAALGGLYSERAGIVNIGLEGMMIMGTWFAAWGAWQFGPWWGAAIGILGGAAGALLHAIATVTFNVDHIVSGVAINILALGGMRFLSVIAYADPDTGGGNTQSPRVAGIPGFDVPFLAGGHIFGWRSPDLFGWLEDRQWFFVSDLFGVLRGVVGNMSWLTLLGLALVPITWYVLWRTPWGLRLRSCGEHPWAAESLGVAVYRMKYYGVVISGALAGLGGAFLVLVQANIYREGQTAGRGFIGLATMIFGNWRPTGALGGAILFGFADALSIRDPGAIRSLLLVVGIGLLVLALVALARRTGLRGSAVRAVAGAGFVLVFLTVSDVPSQFIFVTPYVVTLLVLAVASQRLRMPAADGARYRKGEAT